MKKERNLGKINILGMTIYRRIELKHVSPRGRENQSKAKIENVEVKRLSCKIAAEKEEE